MVHCMPLPYLWSWLWLSSDLVLSSFTSLKWDKMKLTKSKPKFLLVQKDESVQSAPGGMPEPLQRREWDMSKCVGNKGASRTDPFCNGCTVKIHLQESRQPLFLCSKYLDLVLRFQKAIREFQTGKKIIEDSIMTQKRQRVVISHDVLQEHDGKEDKIQHMKAITDVRNWFTLFSFLKFLNLKRRTGCFAL